MAGDPFLDEFHIADEQRAIRDSVNSAVSARRGLRVYKEGIDEKNKSKLREHWEALIREESRAYVHPAQRITDKQHCAAIDRIAKALSRQCGTSLHGRKLRFGASQKAFNLYLKYLWRLGQIVEPPHCPLDDIVLRIGGLYGSWTTSDSQQEYMDWIRWLRMRAKRRGLTLSVWEYDAWWAQYKKAKSLPA